MVAQQEEEAAKIRDQFLRERADLDNFKKRMQREKSESLRFASEPLIRDLLPVIDNLERALNAAPPPTEGQADALRDGVAMVAQQFDDILARFGVARVEAAGQPFDPSEHEALAHIETTQQEPGAVLDEHLPGYRLHDRLLRPAQVTVAKAPGGQGN
jgi:molecular chaperone GrpE